jgi:hypothetical protein
MLLIFAVSKLFIMSIHKTLYLNMKENTITEKVRCCGCTSDTCKSSAPSANNTATNLDSNEQPAKTIENHQTHGSNCGSAHKILEQLNTVEHT